MESTTRPLDPDTINRMVLDGFPGSRNRCVEVGSDYAVAHLIASDADLRPGGYISGPTQFSLADAVLWYLVFGAIGRMEPMALTSELSIRFLRPAIGTELWARAALDIAGRRNVVGSVRVWTVDETKPCSVAQGTYALPHQPTPMP
jgi:uncharacterized protein (TIGR00369 family)